MKNNDLTTFKQFMEYCRNNTTIEISRLTDDIILKCKNGSKIHIKKSHRGRFTKYCNGRVTSECISKGKNSSDPKVRRMATFAQNSRKWKH